MPAWSRRDIKENGTTIGRILYTPTTQAKYRELKGRANLNRVNRFAQRSSFHGGGGIKKVYVSAKLRTRPSGAARDNLAGIGVVNPGYVPANVHKAHLASDRFGGPSNAQNLVNEKSRINLSAHKRIENRIAKLIKAGTPAGDNSPTRNRAGLIVRETYSAAGKPTGRLYMVSVMNRNNNSRSYHKLEFRPI
ncbi:DNA/RNA non-specific endonuclease [Dyella marensis]|jgi:hypothetical protein|uniref:DNA/RNA non-specific endonuclease n=1 Tax=Dyella marensis TaxID=500610 RepID=A0A1I1XBU3_9GAMM|nr:MULTISPECIES: DNA/RNA non-specific endonuclease [Dyella]SFE04849.1 DNA/RNA non-specific endonuclease [Dyella marensis]